MKCVDASEMLRIHAGQMSPEEIEALNQHVVQCESCATLRDEIDGMTRRLAADPGEFDEPEFSSDVMTLIRTGRADREFSRPARRPLWRTWRTWLLVPATAAATAVLLLLFWPQIKTGQPDRTDELQARGGSTEDPDRWVSLRIYRKRGPSYELVERDLRRGDALAFAYLNRPPSSFRYLMILGVDLRGRIFWYYPAHVDSSKNPRSIRIRAGERATELPDQVRQEWGAGALRIFGLFSDRPLDIRSVEQRVARQMAEVRTVERLERINIDGVGQHSLLLRVRAPARDVRAPARSGAD